MPKLRKRSRGGKTASTASPASHRLMRASTRAATTAPSSATGRSMTDPTTHGTKTPDPGVSLGDLLELVQAQARRLTELQAQQQSANAASPPSTSGAAHQGTCYNLWTSLYANIDLVTGRNPEICHAAY